MSEKTHYSVGSYKPDALGAVEAHARNKGIPYKTVSGPFDRKLEDGTKLTVAEGMIAIVLITKDIKVVNNFWDDFVVPA